MASQAFLAPTPTVSGQAVLQAAKMVAIGAIPIAAGTGEIIRQGARACNRRRSKSCPRPAGEAGGGRAESRPRLLAIIAAGEPQQPLLQLQLPSQVEVTAGATAEGHSGFSIYSNPVSDPQPRPRPQSPPQPQPTPSLEDWKAEAIKLTLLVNEQNDQILEYHKEKVRREALEKDMGPSKNKWKRTNSWPHLRQKLQRQ